MFYRFLLVSDMTTSLQDIHLKQAQSSLQQALSWYGSFRRHWNYPPNPELQAAVREDLQSLKAALEKLEQNVFKIATFGLVSRGKSAVINGLLGQKILPTGPLHGVTKYPKSIHWTPPSGKIQIELIDTPGLDEIEGETRAKMAQEVAQTADLILFVVAGDITQTEYKALVELRKSQKPLILVFNKIDLYPDQDREAIYQQLKSLGQRTHLRFSPDEIVRVAAEPQPIPIRTEYPDGKIEENWETLPPQLDELRETILKILNREGKSLLAINSLIQAQKAESNIAKITVKIRKEEAEAIIWNYAKYKSLAVALNPVAIFDIIGGFITDLSLIRSLARLYGLPITSFEAGKLWRKILMSSGGLLLGEMTTNLVLGLGKTGTVTFSLFESPTALSTYASLTLLQGSIAGYSAYIIGKAAQEYLEKGCSWGDLGASTVIQTILNEVDPDTIISRLQTVDQ